MNRVLAPGVASIAHLQVLVQSRSVTASECIFKHSQLWHPTGAPNSLNYGLQVHTIKASKCTSKLARLWPPGAYVQARSIMASQCISKLTRSLHPSSHELCLPVHLQTHTIMISERISNLSRLGPLSVSPDMFDYRLQVHLQTRSIVAS